MNLLLDTHILLWALTEDTRLPAKAREMILDEKNAIYYSTVSVWEIAIKHANHPDNVEMTGKEFAEACRDAGYLPLAITRQEGAPPHHDPFDRMLIAQAKEENMSLVTHDGLLPYYNEKCVIAV